MFSIVNGRWTANGISCIPFFSPLTLRCSKNIGCASKLLSAYATALHQLKEYGNDGLDIQRDACDSDIFSSMFIGVAISPLYSKCLITDFSCRASCKLMNSVCIKDSLHLIKSFS